MATAYDVKVKIQGLIDKANAKTGKNDTDLTKAVDTLMSGYGHGGSSCSGSHVIEVTELPNNTPSVYIVGDGQVYTLSEALVLGGVTNVTVNIQLVEALPDNLELSTLEPNGTVFLYVVESTGVAYGNAGYGAMEIGMYFFDIPDKGWSTDINSETEVGIYCVRSEPKENAVYRISTPLAKVHIRFDGETVAEEELLKVVDSIPADMAAGETCVIKDTGIVYLMGGDGTLITLSEFLSLLGANVPDKGWTDDITSETEDGVYCVRSGFTSKFYTYSNGEWSEYLDYLDVDKAVKEATDSFIDYLETSTSRTKISIPEGVKYIDRTLLYGRHWNNLNTVIFPTSLIRMEGYSVCSFSNLATVIFKGTPSNIYQSAFYECNAIKDIYVPWAEGTVASAPWGAPDTVTIHYNTDTSSM